MLQWTQGYDGYIQTPQGTKCGTLFKDTIDTVMWRKVNVTVLKLHDVLNYCM